MINETDDIGIIFKRALTRAIRRERICKHAPYCKKCKSKQVQLINSLPLAEWKCRHCNYKFKHEPIILNTS